MRSSVIGYGICLLWDFSCTARPFPAFIHPFQAQFLLYPDMVDEQGSTNWLVEDNTTPILPVGIRGIG